MGRAELAELDIGLDEEDACDLLAALTVRDSAGRLRSGSTGEWMYIFEPSLDENLLYVKIVLRSDRILVSFQEDPVEP